MKVIVVTTIAQYIGGLDLHIRNIEWALSDSGIDYRIIIQTFSQNNLIIKNQKIKLINYDSDPNIFFPFWDHSYKILTKSLDKADVFLFMESDIFFTERILEDIYKCYEENVIINRMSDYYFSICDNEKKILYPHIWEGACLIPKKYIEMAIRDGVNFGSNKSWLLGKEKLTNKYYTFFSNNFINLFNLIESGHFISRNFGFFETLFEFQFYAFINNFNVNGMLCGGSNCEIGNKVVHFRGVDSFVMNFKHKNPYLISQKIKYTNSIWNLYISSCTFLFFINGELKKDKELKKCLLRDYQFENRYLGGPYSIVECFKEKIKNINKNCKEWMTDKELDRLFFINNNIK